ncbi:hypothetical protein BB559_003193 [Furculomyces boomerangus]|uniref:N(6)-L-threonylcarbamoyladenine synthase n=1 Tax=Furculomyces boomerangus TaxID=61424 RepID=A0A2T9YMZ2_9FUNG|nr:hypothetical protein BB559_003193 [Furculomyces boomerangus]
MISLSLKTKSFLLNPSRFLLFRSSAYSTANHIRILGIESSCDDTAAAIVSSQGIILSEAARNQSEIHSSYGGIVPSLAAEHHTISMPYVIREALDNANLEIPDLDAIAVTRGPGMPGSLAVCLNAAKTLAAVYRKPLVGVHHMEAHALMARMGNEENLKFPFLCLLVSGGHTLLLVAKNVNEYTTLGTTVDDSIGEAYDKISRLLQIPQKIQNSTNTLLDNNDYANMSYGQALEYCARSGDEKRFSLPTPMNKSDTASSLNFSFSGLKSAISRMVDSKEFLLENGTNQADMAASFQYTIAKHLSKKIKLGLQKAKSLGFDPKSFVISGGVASNLYIRNALTKFSTKNNMEIHFPPARLCTDNGVMIAWAGIERFRLGLIDPYSITFRQRWPLDDLGKE